MSLYPRIKRLLGETRQERIPPEALMFSSKGLLIILLPFSFVLWFAPNSGSVIEFPETKEWRFALCQINVEHFDTVECSDWQKLFNPLQSQSQLG